jgi:hypothetical protein
MPPKRGPILSCGILRADAIMEGMGTKGPKPNPEGAYAQAFAYRVPMEKHARMRQLMGRLATVSVGYGGLGMKLYVWSENGFFQRFAGLHRLLGVTASEELWLEIEPYPNEREARKVLRALGNDANAKLLWEDLQRITGPGKSISMGEFERLI